MAGSKTFSKGLRASLAIGPSLPTLEKQGMAMPPISNPVVGGTLVAGDRMAECWLGSRAWFPTPKLTPEKLMTRRETVVDVVKPVRRPRL